MSGPRYGKYRGQVTDNRDPDGLGRVRARVVDTSGEDESGWALPALPYAGAGVGLCLVPPKDAWVWIEYENGDVDRPIWTGCFWSATDVIGARIDPDRAVLRTDSATVTLSTPKGQGEVTVETRAGFKVTMDSAGIKLTAGQASVTIRGGIVSINDGALEVQ